MLTAKHGYRCAVLLNEIADSADIERALVKEPEVGWGGWWVAEGGRVDGGWVREAEAEWSGTRRAQRKRSAACAAAARRQQ